MADVPRRTPRRDTASAAFDVRLLEAGANALNLVKVLAQLTGRSLKDSKDLLAELPQTVRTGLDRDAADELAGQLTAAGAVVEVRPTPAPATPRFTVMLRSGSTDLNLVKSIQQLVGISLKDAKDLLVAAPQPVREGLTRAAADELAAQLRQAGADVEVTPTTGLAADAPWAPSTGPTRPADPAPSPNDPWSGPSRVKPTFTVRLLSGDASNPQLVKLVQLHAGISLKDAKDLVVDAPGVVRTGLDRAAADDLRKQLEDAGASTDMTSP